MRRYRRRYELSDDERRKLDFVFSVFGPGMKEATRAAEAFKANYNRTHVRPITGGHGSIARQDPNFADISLVQDAAKLPDVISAMGFGEYMGSWFQQRHLAAGVYDDLRFPRPASAMFDGIELHDPRGWYHLYGGSPFTMLVDKRKLDGVPVPRHWEDLLDERYRGKLVVGFNIDDINEFPLLYLYRFWGADGLARFTDNLADLVTTLGMMRVSLRERNTHAIFVLPHFFACAAPKEEHLVEVWPEEGAWLAPYYLMARNLEDERVQAILGFLLGDDYAQVLRGRKMAHLYAEPEDGLEGKRYCWIGWDWLAQRDIIETMREIDSIVVPRVLDAHPEYAKGIGRALWNG
ncbi:MAG: ABC transporter substrate-binding protein [Coriobacteriales bacterium]|nr:ABC transporter substrate-binding protein [Coriobacteriales bacterium]